jgi:hypothetical protein
MPTSDPTSPCSYSRKAVCLAQKQQLYIIWSLVWPDWVSNPRSSATRPRKRHLYDLPVHVVMLKTNALGHIMPTSGPTSPFSYSRKTVCLYAEKQQLQKVFGLTQLGLVPTIYRRPKLLSPVCIYSLFHVLFSLFGRLFSFLRFSLFGRLFHFFRVKSKKRK